mmetsp:Transcript_21337/g.48465  ORF Transcript_21337/g.48465 Transcript_21337/m.48465 type:complete len:304 (-) Transcript_21337:154-1065(-)
MELEKIKTDQKVQRGSIVGETVVENDISVERGNRLINIHIFRKDNVLKFFMIIIAVFAVFGLGFGIGESYSRDGSSASSDLRGSNSGSNAKQNEDDTKGTRRFINSNDLISRDIAVNNGLEFTIEDSYQSRALKILEQKGVEKSYSAQKLAQRYALLCLYYSTYSVRTDVTDDQFGYGTVPNWKSISPWKFSWEKDECTWYGIACDTHGLVTRVELTNHLLTGYIPMELKLLNDGPIGVIDLTDNRGLGQGRFPAVFSEFDSLEVLGLQGCSFTGKVPEEVCNRNIKVLVNCDVSCSCCEPCS